MTKIIRLLAPSSEQDDILNRLIDELRVKFGSYLTTKVKIDPTQSKYVWAEMGLIDDGDTVTFSISLPSSEVKPEDIWIDRERLFVPIHVQAEKPMSLFFEDGANVHDVFWFCLKQLSIFGEIYYMEDTDKDSICKNLTKQQKRKLYSVNIDLSKAAYALEQFSAESGSFLQKSVQSLIAETLTQGRMPEAVARLDSIFLTGASRLVKCHWITNEPYFTNGFLKKVQEICGKARSYSHLNFETALAHVDSVFANVYVGEHDLVRFWLCYLDMLMVTETKLPLDIHPAQHKKFMLSFPSVGFERIANEDQSVSFIEQAQVYFHVGNRVYTAQFKIEVNLRRNVNDVKFKLVPLIKDFPKGVQTDW